MKKSTSRVRGRPTSFQGEKLTFLEERADAFLASTNRKNFYQDVSTAFVSKFGYDGAFEKNPPDGKENSPPDPLTTFAPEEHEVEAEHHTKYLKNLHEVSPIAHIFVNLTFSMVL